MGCSSKAVCGIFILFFVILSFVFQFSFFSAKIRSGTRTGERIFSPARRKKLRNFAKIDTHNAPFEKHNKNNKREKTQRRKVEQDGGAAEKKENGK